MLRLQDHIYCNRNTKFLSLHQSPIAMRTTARFLPSTSSFCFLQIIRKLFVLTLLFLLIAIRLPAQTSEGEVPDAVEYAALEAIYRAFEGDTWEYKDNWLQGTTSVDFNTWYGIDTKDGDVERILLQNLSGILPPEIGDLISLKHLGFYDCQLNSVPLEISKLVNLSSYPEAQPFKSRELAK